MLDTCIHIFLLRFNQLNVKISIDIVCNEEWIVLWMRYKQFLLKNYVLHIK